MFFERDAPMGLMEPTHGPFFYSSKMRFDLPNVHVISFSRSDVALVNFIDRRVSYP